MVVLVLEASDDAVLERALGRRVDATTGKEYHLDTLPPPAPGSPEDVGLIERLQAKQDASFEEQQLATRLAAWQQHGQSVIDFYDAVQKRDSSGPQVLTIDSTATTSIDVSTQVESLVAAAQEEQRQRAQAAAALTVQQEAKRRQEQHALKALLGAHADTEASLHAPAPTSPSLSPPQAEAQPQPPASAGKGGKPARSASKAGKTPAPTANESGDNLPSATQLKDAGETAETDLAQQLTMTQVNDLLPGETDYMYCTLDGLDITLARGVVPAWDDMETSYLRGVTVVSQRLRSERQAAVDFLAANRTSFARFIARPDPKQEYVTEFQESFNGMAEEVRCTTEGQDELYQRVEDLKDTLYDISDKRKEEAEAELNSLKGNLWLEEKTAVSLNCHLQLLQGELDHYTTGTTIIQDVYSNLLNRDDPDEAEAAAIPVVPLIQLTGSLEAPPKGRGKGKAPAVVTIPGPEGVPVTAHSPAHNEQTFKTVVEALLAFVPARVDPSIKRAEAAALQQQLLESEAEATAAASAKGKKGKKTVEPPSELARQPSEADTQAQARDAQKAELQAAREDEEYKALLLEDVRFKARTVALQRLALDETARLAALHTALVDELANDLGARYRTEIQAVDALCHEVAKAIVANIRIAYELALNGDTFTIQRDAYSFQPSKLPLPPAPVEAQPASGAFTIKQLTNLYRAAISVAPSGYLPLADCIALLTRLTLAGSALDAVPPSWWGMESSALVAKAQAWARGGPYLDIKHVVLDAAGLATPTPAQLLTAYRQCYRSNTNGTLLASQYRAVAFWFETPPPTPAPDTLALDFHRSGRLKELLFDIFADDCLSYYARELNYNQLLFYLCRGRDASASLAAAVTLAAAQSGRQSLEWGASLQDADSCSTAEVSLLLQASRTVQHVGDEGVLVYQAALDDELLQSLVEMAAAEDDASDQLAEAKASSLFLARDTPDQLACVASSLAAVEC